jgi:hypothetical protein
MDTDLTPDGGATTAQQTDVSGNAVRRLPGLYTRQRQRAV